MVVVARKEAGREKSRAERHAEAVAEGDPPIDRCAFRHRVEDRQMIVVKTNTGRSSHRMRWSTGARARSP
jgi:hypothetical protein